MPSLTINCNVELSKEQATSLVKEASGSVSALLGKPESFVTVSYSTPAAMTWGGTEDPCASCTLASIGKIDADTNASVSAMLSELLRKYCAVESNRYYCEFVDAARPNMGWQGKTF